MSWTQNVKFDTWCAETYGLEILPDGLVVMYLGSLQSTLA